MTEGILAPGYGQRLAEWQQNVLGPAQTKAEIESAKQAAWWKNEQIKAQIGELGKRGLYYEGMGRNPTIDVTQELEDATGGIYKRGQKIPASTASQIAINRANLEHGKYPDRTVKIETEEQAKLTGFPVGTEVPLQIYVEKLKPPHSENEWDLFLKAASGDPVAKAALAQFNAAQIAKARANRAPVDPTIAELREEKLAAARQKGFDDLQNKKFTDEQVIHQDRQSEVANLLAKSFKKTEQELWADPLTAQELRGINQKYAPKLQGIQDNFARGVRTRGGTAEDFMVDPNTLEYKKGGAPSAPRTGQRLVQPPDFPAPKPAAAATPKGRGKLVRKPDGNMAFVPS